MLNISLPEKKWFTTTEVAELLGVSRRTVALWCKEGKIHCIKALRNYRIPREEVEKILHGL